MEKFKLKNNLMGARSRKGSLLPSEPDGASAALSSSHTPNDASPASPNSSDSVSPTDMRDLPSNESLKLESPPESYSEWASRQGSFHSQSVSSLASTFPADAGPSSFSPGPLSPQSSFFTPDSGTAPGEFVSLPNARPPLSQATAPSNSHRPRSSTFPLLPQLDAYMAGSSGPEAMTPKYIGHSSDTLDSPMADMAEHHMASIDDATRRAPATMRPPPLPAHLTDARRESTPARSMSTSSLQATSPDEARRALEVVLGYFEQQPTGFLDVQESIAVGKLMDRLRLHARADSISH